MEKYGLAIDVGTSGTRMHAVDLESNKIISTAITMRHPVPGANVMDHLTFCIEVDRGLAHRLLIDTSNRLMKMLDIDLKKVERVAICGNPIQLSSFSSSTQLTNTGSSAASPDYDAKRSPGFALSSCSSAHSTPANIGTNCAHHSSSGGAYTNPWFGYTNYACAHQWGGDHCAYFG